MLRGGVIHSYLATKVKNEKYKTKFSSSREKLFEITADDHIFNGQECRRCGLAYALLYN